MSKPETRPRLLGAKDAAAYLGVGERCVWSMLSRKELTAVKIGRRSLLDTRDLDAFIDKQKEAAR